jgi:hypothetical protein
MIEEAKRYNAALWLAPRILELYREAAAAGYAHQDSMRLFTYVQSVDRAVQEPASAAPNNHPDQ